jgi:hypothetical protein
MTSEGDEAEYVAVPMTLWTDVIEELRRTKAQNSQALARRGKENEVRAIRCEASNRERRETMTAVVSGGFSSAPQTNDDTQRPSRTKEAQR